MARKPVNDKTARGIALMGKLSQRYSDGRGDIGPPPCIGKRQSNQDGWVPVAIKG